MKKEIFTICDSAESYGDKLIIVGPFTHIHLNALPATHPGFSVVARLRYDKGGTVQKEMTLRIAGPDGKEVIEPVTIPLNLPPREDDLAVFNLKLSVSQLKFDIPGEYRITLDGDDLSEELSFFVIDQSRQSQHSPSIP